MSTLDYKVAVDTAEKERERKRQTERQTEREREGRARLMSQRNWKISVESIMGEKIKIQLLELQNKMKHFYIRLIKELFFFSLFSFCLFKYLY